tara:strand:+ start:603 stop:782 length:180 start_codon:yes stop_codon:yes gene_type:complete
MQQTTRIGTSDLFCLHAPDKGKLALAYLFGYLRMECGIGATCTTAQTVIIQVDQIDILL